MFAGKAWDVMGTNRPEQAALERICQWLTDREGTPRPWNALEMLQLALHYCDVPGLYAMLRASAAEGRGGNRSQGMALRLAAERLNSALPRQLLPVNRAASRAQQLRRFAHLQNEAMAAIASAYEARGAPAGTGSTALGSLEALRRIAKAANSSLDVNETCDFTADAIVSVMDVDECSVWILDETTNRLVLRSTTGLNRDQIGQAGLQIGEGISGSAAELGRSIAVRDAWADPRFKVLPALDEEIYRSLLAVPIVLANPARLLGVLSIRSRIHRDFPSEEIEFVETAAEQLATALWNATLYQQTDERLRQRNNELTTLQRISQNLTSRLEYTEVLSTIAEQAAAILNADKAAIFQLDDSAGDLSIVAAHKLSARYRNLRLRLGEGVAGRVAERRAPLIVEDALSDQRLRVSRELIEAEGYRSMICVPLMFRGSVIGVISVYSVAVREFVQEELRIIASFADQAAIAMANARLYEQSLRGLHRNELLLRELHHRVKNNLQTVASLLNLQSRRTRSPEVASVLALSAGRIAGMAAVHDLLSAQEDEAATAIEIVNKMAEIASSDASATGMSVQISVDGDRVEIDEDRATVFALVVNELIWNAMGHGFDVGLDGRIRVRIEVDAEMIKTSVRDNGCGLPPNFELGRDSGLGLTIVQQLVESDLGGNFSLQNDDGCVAAVAFPRPRPAGDRTIPVLGSERERTGATA